ncbi:SDR family NAD(P)-dependent oxidoreductase [Parasphingopyxis algicola]|uniref:SDR family NAD(P)-dependent oxidoreductase n=1 Tax=Parasphingopyxis algicola TaxID=2026624 RepID=UPI0015A0B8A5|nr:SDR family NAD(P)-dependent oxidoreductase [Parasphingopyxis algicola]QLC25990.1 SDR family NAD(P)-dependent oxidoreductase [Parasphingopyxis algicola]
MPHMLIFGLGYTAGLLAERLRSEGWIVSATRRAAGPDAMAFDDREAVTAALGAASHILSSVPPVDGRDIVLDTYGAALAEAPAGWIGYLSSTGVYGDTDGAWVDETAPIGGGRRKARAEADAAWQGLRGDIRVFRLPGIYGPGRSVLDRIRSGKAHRIDLPGQVFSRVHADDIVAGVMAGFEGPAGVYNLADDRPAPHNDVVAYGCRLLGVEPPPLQTMDEAGLSDMARGFYSENRRVANGKAKRLLGWTPAYPDYRAGLRAVAAV